MTKMFGKLVPGLFVCKNSSMINCFWSERHEIQRFLLKMWIEGTQSHSPGKTTRQEEWRGLKKNCFDSEKKIWPVFITTFGSGLFVPEKNKRSISKQVLRFLWRHAYPPAFTRATVTLKTRNCVWTFCMSKKIVLTVKMIIKIALSKIRFKFCANVKNTTKLKTRDS